MIYFDNAATTFPKPECVYEAVNDGMHKYSFNAGRGNYKQASETYKMIEETRGLIAKIGKTTSERVVFTSSATEALNIIVGGLDINANDCIFVSPFEHNAVIRSLNLYNCNIEIIPFDRNSWEIDKEKLNDFFVLKKPKAVFISHVSNVTGFMLPYEVIFSISKKYGCINVLDSSQAFGIHDITEKNIDYLVFAGHKSLYSMFGVGGFIKYKDDNLFLKKAGGTGSDSLNPKMPDSLPYRYEAGTINSVAIYSLKCSINYLNKSDFMSLENSLMRYLLVKLKGCLGIKVFLPDNYVPFGIVSIALDGFSSDDVGNILYEDYNICVRSGYHCAPYVHNFIGSIKYGGTVRISLGGFNTKDEIDYLIRALKEIQK